MRRELVVDGDASISNLAREDGCNGAIPVNEQSGEVEGGGVVQGSCGKEGEGTCGGPDSSQLPVLNMSEERLAAAQKVVLGHDMQKIKVRWEFCSDGDGVTQEVVPDVYRDARLNT